MTEKDKLRLEEMEKANKKFNRSLVNLGRAREEFDKALTAANEALKHLKELNEKSKEKMS